MQTAIRYHLPQILFFLILLVLLSPAKPINAESSDLCLNVAHTVGISTYNLKTQKLTTPDFTGLDLLLANTQYAKWSGTRASYVWQQTQDQWALSITDIQTHQTITTTINGQGLLQNNDGGMSPRFFGWSGDGQYVAVEVLRHTGYTLLFYSSKDARVVKEIVRNPFVLDPTMRYSDADPDEGHWSPLGHSFAMFLLLNTGELGVSIFAPDRDSLTFRWPHPDYSWASQSFGFVWSPDAKYLAAIDYGTVRVFGLDGKTYLEDVSRSDLVWSTDSHTLYYVIPGTYVGGVCRGFDLIGFSPDTNHKRIAASDFWGLDWSPDFQYLLLSGTDSDLPCTSGGAPDFPMTYRLVNVDSGKQIGAVFRRDNRTFGLPVLWSPDSKAVALLLNDGLAWMQTHDGTTHVLPETGVAFLVSSLADRQFKWSADGQWMAYPSGNVDSDHPDISTWLTNVENGNSIDLGIHSDRLPQMFPSPHGSPVAILTIATNDSSSGLTTYSLWLVSNGRARKLNDNVRDDAGYTAGSSLPVWSPDGTLLAYIAGEKDDHWTIYIVRADGAEVAAFDVLANITAHVPAFDGTDNPIFASLDAALSWGQCTE